MINSLRLFIIILFAINTFVWAGQECDNVICARAKNCRDCIRIHVCCNWCYDKNYTGPFRCIGNNLIESVCNKDNIEKNVATNISVVKNEEFADFNKIQTVQFRPNKFSINLRYDEPAAIEFQYRPAKNYPLDLYYLMDLTKTMEDDLITLKDLGSDLTKLLSEITTNYRIAFGSYIDIPELPFYHTDPQNRENPCYLRDTTCEKGYLFKHKLNFTNDVSVFSEKVNKSRVSANTDNLEGGMIALMQIMLCGNKLGWLDTSRKLVIIATEGTMHFAGDGILAGYVKRNMDACLINDEGNYTSLINYDYPSLEEVHNKLNMRKVNVIIAAKSVVLDYYNKMTEVLKPNIYVGELKSNSSNVLDLVKNGYYAFIRQVTLSMNTSDVKGLKVEFFADCDDTGIWKKTKSCDNAEEGKIQNFKVEFLLTEYQDIDKKVFYIKEKNIYEEIEVDINFVDSNCKCPNVLPTPEKKCVHGSFSCGDCACDERWEGQDCSKECVNDLTMCRHFDENDGFLSLACSGNGTCKCSECHCDFSYEGKFCQYQCPVGGDGRRVCGGHGSCKEGNCTCDHEYTGVDCACHESDENCKIPGTKILCSELGKCQCNKCICKAGYKDQYCSNLCSQYEPILIDYILHNKPNSRNESVYIDMIESFEDLEDVCVYPYDDEKGNKCNIYFKYKLNKNRSVNIKATKSCTSPLSAGLLSLYIIAAFLALAALIVIVIKGRNIYRDKKEYEKFKRDQKLGYHREENPLYKSPVVTYQNPMERVNIHNKTD